MLRSFFSSVLWGLCLALGTAAIAQEPTPPEPTQPPATETQPAEPADAEPADAEPAANEPADEPANASPADTNAGSEPAADAAADEQPAQADKSTLRERATAESQVQDASAGPTPEPMPLSTPESVEKSVSPEAPSADASDQGTAEESAEARQERLDDLLTLVSDNTLGIHKRELPAYYALVKEVLTQTPEELRSKARPNPRFDDFYRHSAEHRGELVHLAVNMRRVIPVDIKGKNEAGVTRLYELWGWTDEAKAWMYCCITPELPPGFPVQGDIAQRVELTGYFFKMQAYQPGDAAPNARNLVAPLIIGRITPAPNAPAEVEPVGNWPFYLIGGFGLIILMRVLMQVRSFSRSSATPTHRNYHRRPIEPLDAETLTDSLSSERGLPIRNADE